MKKIVSLLLCVIMLSVMAVSCAEEPEVPVVDTPRDDAKVVIAYIPIDDRPVSVDRVKYLAGSADFELRMPDSNSYATVMDAMASADTAHGGDPKALLDWLKSQEESGVDNYVISLDQIFSGGLVASRVGTGSGKLSEFETELVKYLAELAKNNRVVYYDTVMRLAATNGYRGYDLDAYYATRAYGTKERYELNGEELNVDNIIACYPLASDGATTLSLTNVAVDTGKEYTLSTERLEEYLSARERKLRIINDLINLAGSDIDRLIIGVDDSSATKNIQYNERRYIDALATEKGIRHDVLAATDELGMLGVTALATELLPHDDVKSKIPVNVTYFGENENMIADAYTYMTLKETVELELSAMGATVSNDPKALQALVLTQQTKYPTAADNEYAKALVAQLKANLDANIPTCVIDASNPYGGNARLLGDWLLKYGVEDGEFNLAELLSFSCWNTVSNSVGTGLANAVTRYTYLSSVESASEKSNDEFLKALTFALIKDIAYKGNGNQMNLESTANWYDPQNILIRIMESPILAGIGRETAHGKTVTVTNLTYPWNRNFEARFDINVMNLTATD